MMMMMMLLLLLLWQNNCGDRRRGGGYDYDDRSGMPWFEGSLKVKLLLLAKASKLTFCRLMSRPPYICNTPTYAVVFLVILGENYGRPL